MSKNIKQFVKENINVPKDLWDKAVNRVNNIKDYLYSNVDELEGFDYQGSFSRKTVIRPKRKDEEFDVDITAHISLDNSNVPEMHEFARDIHDKLDKQYSNVSTFGDKPSKATEVRFSKEFHVDVVPLLIDNDEYIHDIMKFENIKSNPLGLTRAFNKMAKTHTENSLRDTIKIIKYIRNLKDIERENTVGVPSIVLDIYYSQIEQQCPTYDENIIALLKIFNNMPSEINNPYCTGEKIQCDIESLNLLKEEIKIVIEKFEKNDFSGLKNAFKAAGVTFAAASSIAASVAASIGKAGLHVSGTHNNN